MFRLDDEGKVVELTCSAEDLESPLSMAMATAMFNQSEYAAYLLSQEQLEHAVAELSNPEAFAEEAIRTFPIATRKDGEILVAIDESRMQAMLQLVGAYGGTQADADLIKKALQQAGIRFGVSAKRLQQAAEQSLLLGPGKSLELPIAQGKAPKKGADGEIDQLAKTSKDRMLKPKAREDGSVDMRDLGSVVTVGKGEPLMRRHGPTPGEPGMDITGKPIPPVAGEDIQLYVGEGTELSPSNKDLLVAAREGVPVLLENGMKVDDVLIMPTVDISTGHVRFKGSVIIEGDVHEGMEVESDGDITITGSVDSARIISGGTISIAQGIIGHKLDLPEPDDDEDESIDEQSPAMSAYIEAKGDIHAAFAQYAEIRAEGNIQLERQLTHCLVQTRQDVFVGRDEQPSGRLIGGRISLNGRLVAGEIGTEAGARTDVFLAYEYPKRREEMAQLVEELRMLRAQADETAATIKELHAAGGWEEMVAKEGARYKEMVLQVKSIKVLLLKAKAQCEAMLSVSKIEIHRTLHSRLYVRVIGNKKFISERDYGPSKIAYTDGQLSIDPLIT